MNQTRRTGRHRLQGGFTLVEVIVSSVISTIVLSMAVSVFLMVMASWARGENLMDGENDTRQVVRLVSDELREAMWVSVDADGRGLSYRRPQKDASGEFSLPVVWDGVTRRIFWNNGRLILRGDGGVERVVGSNILTVDPFRLEAHANAGRRGNAANVGAPAYRIFTANNSTLTTEVTVMVVTGSRGANGSEQVRARKREVVVLRNVPELIK